MNGTDGSRRDPRRRFTEAHRRQQHLNQDGMCTCGLPLPDNFEMHHQVAWSLGGPTNVGNAVALCHDCHLKAVTTDFGGVTPRDWQRTALDRVLPLLRASQVATVSAAPGSGKTLFGGLVVTELIASATIERVVIFVPNNVLRSQWVKTLDWLKIFIDGTGRYSAENSDSFQGVVHTYQHLTTSPFPVQELARRANAVSTLYVLDEVHHLAEHQHSAWSRNIASLVGHDPDNPGHPVLNLSGTLFRSNARDRIGTVRYVPVPGMPGKIEARADFQVSTVDLIQAGQLRHVSLWEFETNLEIVHLQQGTVTTGGIIDLSNQAAPVRAEGLKRTLNDEDYLKRLGMEMKAKLMEQYELLDEHPVKALVVCDNQAHARKVHAVLTNLFNTPPYLAVSEDGPDAVKAIEAFRYDRRMAVLVTVRMVTEGFDCPDITTLVHLTPWRAQLFINQMVARAMRVTDTERRLNFILPAAILIPHDQQIRDAYNAVFVETMHLLDLPTVCPNCGQAVCVCARVNSGQGPGGQPPSMLPTFTVEVLGGTELAGVAHDGDEINMGVYNAIYELNRERGLPHIYDPTVAAIMQDAFSRLPDQQAAAPSVRQITLTDRMQVHLTYMDRCARWWQNNGDSNAATFNAKVNDILGVDRHWATLAQLERASTWCTQTLRNRCAQDNRPAPRWLKG